MTKLIIDLKSLNHIDEYKVAGFIINDPDFSCFNDNTFKLEEIEEAILQVKQRNQLIFINLNRIIEQEELNALATRLDWYFSLPIDYIIYSDLSIYSYCMNKTKNQKLIYSPDTLMTNSKDAFVFSKINQMVMISNELNLSEIKDITEVGNGMMEVYGYHQIFYSRRLLISNFARYENDNRDFAYHKYQLKEELRKDLYGIFETKKGTFIYNPYRYCLFYPLNELNKLHFAKISGMFIEEKELVLIANLYHKGLETGFHNHLFEQLVSINNHIHTGYLYKSKEENNND